MANSHPYISGAGSVASMVQHLRKSFPATVDAETVKKLGLASNNESYVINALKFIGVLDDEGKKTDEASKIFAMHKDADFEKSFGALIEQSYSELFSLHGDDAWKLDKDDLITFFRSADQTSAVIGGRQANLFKTFCALSGHGEIKTAEPKAKKNSSATNTPSKKPAPKQTQSAHKATSTGSSGDPSVSLNVKIEVNIPSDASADAYDAIFASIRKHLMDG